MLKSVENYALVEIEKKFQDETGGIAVDYTWHPEEHATLEGTVITAPLRTASDDYRTILGTVKEGDKIFFSYGVIFQYDQQPDEDTPIYSNLIIHEGKEYWRVEMGEIFCTVRDGVVQMVTDNILLEPVGEKTMYDQDARELGIVVGMPPRKLSCEKGDTIAFESRFAQEYSFFDKIHYIIPARRVVAKIS